MKLFKKTNKSSARISITAHYTGFIWYYYNLSHRVFTTNLGRVMFYLARPWSWFSLHIFGITSVEKSCLQRHVVIDHLLKKAIKERGITQVLELACGLSPRGYRFKSQKEFYDVMYVEADLPGMTSLKRAKLEKAGTLSDRHIIVTCDLLATEGSTCLGSVIKEHFDTKKPIAILTEGIVYYFNRKFVDNIWKQVSTLFRSLKNSIYLFDNILDTKNRPRYGVVKYLTKFLEILTRGRFYLHFDSNREIEETFKSLGFNTVKVHEFDSFYEELPIIRSPKKLYMNVVEAG